MDFSITETRQILADSLSRTLADHCTPEHRLNTAYALPAHDPALWARLGELGVFYAFLPEETGGFGGAGFDITTVFEALGQALCPEPVLGQLMAARTLALVGEDVDAVLEGSERWAMVLDPMSISENGLTGHATVVYGAGVASKALVPVRTGSGDLHMFVVDANDCDITAYPMIDGGPAGDIHFNNVSGRMIAANAAPLLSQARDWGALALCAEAVGAAQASVDMTLEYLKTRKQFGRAIGEFQALQHRMVDLAIELEQARSITIRAASKMESEDRSHAVAMAKYLVGRVAQLVAEEAIQMHGGIAMTWDAPISHYAKRLVMIDHQLGDQDTHLMTLMQGLGYPR